MRQPKILVVGSFVMDLITSTERFPDAGETVLGAGFHTATGGKGANQALQAQRLGADVTMVGKVGTDAFGQQLVSTLSQASVRTEHVLYSVAHPSAIGNILITLQNGRVLSNRIIVVSGANMELTPADVSFLENTIAEYDMVLLQLEIPMAVNVVVAEYARKSGVPVMLNSAPIRELPPQLLRNIRYISPNEHEAAILTGCDLSRNAAGLISIPQLQAATTKLRGFGIPEVIITLGHQGAVYSGGKDWLLCPSVHGIDVVDPTAAGDSFVGAYCFGVCRGLSSADACAFASCAAAITVSRMGAQPSLPTFDEIIAFATQHGLCVDVLSTLCATEGAGAQK